MKLTLFILAVLFHSNLFAQKETFDLVSYTLPKDTTGISWKKEVSENITSYTTVDNTTGSWCRINIVKSTTSKGSIEQDFESEWQNLVVKNYKPTDLPQLNEVMEIDGWKIKAGGAKFTFNKTDAIAMLTTASGYERCVSIVAISNSQDYLKDIEAFILSVHLEKPVTVLPQTTNGFAYTTTNFDDGWTGTAKEDWVEVTKSDLKVLIHYPDKNVDRYSHDLLEGLKNAWNVLVAPKYRSAANMQFKPVSGWESIEFAEADMIEKTTGKPVYVVLFKKNYSNGDGKYLELIASDKKSFEREFGSYENAIGSSGPGAGWDKIANMINYNKFAVGASDLTGKWTSNFTGMIQYVNAYTGASAGANTHASNENFEFGAGNTYKWDLGVASGFVGSIKFQSVKSSGKFSMVGNWQVSFSDIEGKPKTYIVQFTCIKGARILWIDRTAFGKKE